MRGRAAARSARRRAILVFASCATTIRDTRNVRSRHGCDAWLAFRPEVRSSHWSARNQILVSRALAPVELAIANWKGFVAARQSRRRLSDLLHLLNQEQRPMALPPPRQSLSVEALSIAPPGQQRQQSIVVHDATFTLQSGQGLGVIGPSAAGKSSLARGIVGVWAPVRGKVRLDGAALEQWSSEGLGPHIGYLPQDVELFDGTVAENIARFAPDSDPESIIAAAQAGGVHDLIVRLPDGYETLTQAILGARKRGAIVIVIAHRPSALLGVDLLLAIANGRVQTFGPKEEVLQKVLERTKPHLRPVKLAPEGEVRS